MRRCGRWALLLALAGIAALAVVACGASERPVVYVTEVDGNPDIYVIDADTGEFRPVERGLPAAASPVWSPDGKRIAFAVDEAGSQDIIVAPFDDEETPQPLARGGDGNEGSPRWDADGDRVAYVSELDGDSGIYVSALEGGSPVRITSGDGGELLGDWSPDGEWLVFSRQGGEDAQGIWLRNPAGVNLLRLTEDADSDPVWSPDGDVIAFVRDDYGNSDIYLLSPDDGEDWRGAVTERRRISSADADHSPAWHPKGDILAFVSTRDGNPEIYAADARESDPPQRLTINQAADTEPVWSPGGERIAFVSDLYGEGEIFVMDADGGNQKRLTNNDVRDYSPDW